MSPSEHAPDQRRHLRRTATNDFAAHQSRSSSAASAEEAEFIGSLAGGRGSVDQVVEESQHSIATADGTPLHELLAQCAPHNSEGYDADDDPVRGRSMWVRYNAGRRKDQWREVWPFKEEDDSRFPHGRAFRALEEPEANGTHFAKRQTKYIVLSITAISGSMPPDYTPSSRCERALRPVHARGIAVQPPCSTTPFALHRRGGMARSQARRVAVAAGQN
jgi:hypothetical protein